MQEMDAQLHRCTATVRSLGENDAASRFLHAQFEVDAVIRQERTVPPVDSHV